MNAPPQDQAANPAPLTELLKGEAANLGFTLTGACPAVTPAGINRFGEWLDRGYGGEMEYLAARQAAYEHPRYVMSGVRSLLMLGLPYETVASLRGKNGYGKVSRYAWGETDYHDVIHDKLKRLLAVLWAAAPQAKARGVVDSAPLLEREFAQLAGLGWIGKHTLLIAKPQGSYFFLAALLTDQELAYDEPFSAEHCGTCRACLDACPTGAFPQPHVLDATRCVSYLTIELRGPIPRELRPGIGDWLFGCDVCQDVCPWNHRSSGSARDNILPGDFLPAEGRNPVRLVALFELDDEAFRRRFRDTPLWRARRRGILRNAAIVLGNQRCAAAVPALTRAIGDAEPLIRGSAAWALGQIGGAPAAAALADRLALEPDAVVRQELEMALAAARQIASPAHCGPRAEA